MNLSNVWLSSEEWAATDTDPQDEIVDVVATLSDGSRWTATICTFKHVETLRKKWHVSGESLNGKYLWAINLILAIDISRSTVEALINDLLAEDNFHKAFSLADVSDT